MLHVAEVALGILPTAGLPSEEILGHIMEYIHAKCNVALDRMAFWECRHSATETFDEFYIRFRNLAGPAELCPNCIDEQLVTNNMKGIKGTPT